MFRKLLQNTREPAGLGGKLMLWGMNRFHAPLAAWGSSHLSLRPDAVILDIGCGGGANIARFLRDCPAGRVCGMDYARESVAHSLKKNAAAIAGGRCEVRQGEAAAIPYEEAEFDVVTAFETVYFWGDLDRAFAEVYRVLKPGGVFLICNEASEPDRQRWTRLIDGMVVPCEAELRGALRRAGFEAVESDRKDGGYVPLCVLATKGPASSD